MLFLRLPGAGTMRLEMASSFILLSVGGGGQTKLSIISTFRPRVEIAGGSIKRRKLFQGCVITLYKVAM